MSTLIASLLALALAFAGMVALSFAMDRHFEQLTRRRETPRPLRALLRRPDATWREQLALLAGLCLLLPLLNFATTGDHLPAQWLRGDWESAGVEAVSLAFGLAAVGALRFMRGRRAQDTAKALP